ncbi:MAG: MFS transporter [Anaerolineae bacterium]|nr:MFS transporter [Anaerolineae bacterium]
MNQHPSPSEKQTRLRIPSPREFLARYARINFNNRDDRNSFYMVAEIFWATFLDAAMAFNAAYAIRLGASDQEIGLLSSIPALFAIFLSIPLGKVLQRTPNKKKLLLGSLTIYRLGYIFIALIPWLNFLNLNQGSLVVFALIFFTICDRPFIISFAPMQSTVIPRERQAPVISLRMQIYHAVRSLSVFLLGFWLDAILFPLNYQLMYIVTFALSIFSIVSIARIELPPNAQLPAETKQERKRFSLRASFAPTFAMIRENPRFLRFMVNTLMMDFGMWAINPLFSIFYIKNLEASDGWLGTFSAIHSVCNIIGYGIWRPIVRRVGETRMLKLTALLRPLYPLAIALFPNLTAILVIGGAWGLLIPGLGLSHSSTYLQMLPPEAREEAQSIHSTIQNSSMFLSPLLGIAISEWIGIPGTLLLFAGVRLLGSLTWTLFPIDHPRYNPQPAGQ